MTFSVYNTFSVEDTIFSVNVNYLLEVGKSVGHPLYQKVIKFSI